MAKPETICVFGDSTAWGAWDTEKGGWVNRLWLDAAKDKGGNYVEICNLSISGGTSETILERFENETKVRKADALLFQTGGNDASYRDEPGNYIVSPEKFRENISEIIRRAKKITGRIIFMDLKNCDESKTMPVPWVNIFYTNENMEKYGGILKEVCGENNVLLLDVELLTTTDFDDGLHPNAEGHRKIFEQAKYFLTEHGWI